MLHQRMFVVIIKENSTSAIYLQNKKITNYFSGDIVTQQDNFRRFFKQSRFAKIIVVLANEEQKYIEKTFVSSSLDESEKLAKITLKEGYSENVFRGMIGDNSKAHSYVFITIKINKQIEACIKLLLQLPNYLANILAYAIERKMCEEKELDEEVQNADNYDATLSYFISAKNNTYKLYHPTISTLMITEKLNFVMNILLAAGISLMIIIFTFLAYYF